MADAVAFAIASRRHLAVQAGTGTGKSLGYLVPAALCKKRVVIATATKTLQDQLATKDLPLIKDFGPAISFAVLKGRANYLCVQKLNEATTLPTQGEFGQMRSDESIADEEAPFDENNRGEQARQVLAWAASTITGDRAELLFEPDERVWSSFSVTAEQCPGAFRCPSGGECFAEAARNRAASADLVVVNMHLLGADLASDGALLPEHDVLVVDEAHAFEDVVSASLGVTLSGGKLRSLAALGRQALVSSRARPGIGSRGEKEVDAVMDVARLFDEHLASRGQGRIPAPIDAELTGVIDLIRARIERLDENLRDALDERSGSGASAPGDSQRALRALAMSERVRDVLDALRRLDDASVAWVQGRDRLSLEVAPVDVAPILSEVLFARRCVILTGATLPGGLAVRLGASPNDVDELDVGSPFDYEHHALLYCAAHLPDRRHPDAEDALIDELGTLIRAAGGRTLALFTSHAVMAHAEAMLRDVLSFPILVQGKAGKAALLENFSAMAESCLFATMGFWQGVDVPGPTLSLVVIDRIPFPRPDDPLLSARRDRIGSSAFRAIDLPRAATLLAQGAGRLIRGPEDKGVVAVLDSRLARASYREALLRVLPPMRRTIELTEACAFLDQLRAIHEPSG
jgi:ATP-dependent DNA helicase DinG